MRYDSLRAFEKHLEGAAPRLFSSLYCVVGKDAFDCQEAIHLILRFLLPSQHMRECGLSVFEGTQVEEKELETALSSYSFFSKSRVIWISQVDKLKKPIQEILEGHFSRPQPSQYLLLSAFSFQKNPSFYKAIEKTGIVLEFADLKPWEKEKYLADWVNKHIAARRKLISYQVCQVLVKQIGNDRAMLTQEVEKLLCYCEEKKEITLQDVEDLCFKQPIESVWQLGEAIFRRDTAASLQIAHSLLMDGQALLPLLRQIRSQFQIEYQICLLLSQGKQAQDIMQEFPYMKGQILDRHMRQALHYGLTSFKSGLLALDATEIRVKNSSIDEKILIELLIFKLTT